MSKNISLASAKAFPSWTPHSSRFGGLRPSFLKNRAHLWRGGIVAAAASAGAHSGGGDESGVGPRQSVSGGSAAGDDGLDNLASTRVDVGLGRLQVSPHATFSYPSNAHLQLLVRYPHHRNYRTRRQQLGRDGGGGEGEGEGEEASGALTTLDTPSLIRHTVLPFTEGAMARYGAALRLKEERDAAGSASKRDGNTNANSNNNKGKKSSPSSRQQYTVIPSDALQCLVDYQGIVHQHQQHEHQHNGDGTTEGRAATASKAAAAGPHVAVGCSLYSKRINAWSLYAKAMGAYYRGEGSDGTDTSGAGGGGAPPCSWLPRRWGHAAAAEDEELYRRQRSGASYAVVMATDCRVSPAAEAIAQQFPHYFQWVPIAVQWDEAGPLAPDGPFRSPVHTTPRGRPYFMTRGGGDAVGRHEGGGGEAVVVGSLPQQPVQLRALVPLVDPALECPPSLSGDDNGTVLCANPIAVSIYNMLFSDRVGGAAFARQGPSSHGGGADADDLSADAPPLHTILFVQSRIRDVLLMPLLVSAADTNITASGAGAAVTGAGGASHHRQGLSGGDRAVPMAMLRRAVLRRVPLRNATVNGTAGAHEEREEGGGDLDALLYVDKRLLMRACGWSYFSRWLGSIDKIVDPNRVRLI